MPKKPNYCCIRCGYETDSKSHMHKHLFLKKTPCPQLKNLIELTNEIKQHIMDNRIYIIPKVEKPTKIINNIMNQNNTMNNFIGNMDHFDKITKYKDCTKIKALSYGDKIESNFEVRSNNLQNNTNDLVKLKTLDFIEHINEVSRSETIKDFNILYDAKTKTLNLYTNGIWEKKYVTNGIKDIILKIQEAYWDVYEFYLIRKIYQFGTSFKNKQISDQFIERLKEYYKFIGCFDVDSNVKDKSDNNILNNENDDPGVAGPICDKYWKIYVDTRDELKKKEITSITKKVIDIITHNTAHSIDEMNKQVIKLFNMDETFKQMILNI